MKEVRITEDWEEFFGKVINYNRRNQVLRRSSHGFLVYQAEMTDT